MLDLNVASPGSGEEPHETPLNDSGSSTSSVVIAEGSGSAGDEDSCSTRSGPQGFRFGILKDGHGDAEAGDDCGEDEVNNASPRVSFSTRQLFPQAAVGVEDSCGAYFSPVDMAMHLGSSSSTAKPHWPKFGLCPTEHSEMRVMQQQHQVKKGRRGPRSRSSQYRGVTFYRRTGRWESHIWDCGKQVYLGGYDTAYAAARAYDRAAIKFRGVDADINFNLNDYDEDMKQMQNLTKEEFVHILRRQSTGFSRGSSKYRGVTLHKCGRWEARMGQLLGKKAYDRAAIKCNGREAVTNFEPSIYKGEITSEINFEASSCSIDLNLRISQPISNVLKRGHDAVTIYFQNCSLEPPDTRKYGARAADRRPETPANTSWTWQSYGSTPPLSSSAASSRFSVATVTAIRPPAPPGPANYPSTSYKPQNYSAEVERFRSWSSRRKV